MLRVIVKAVNGPVGSFDFSHPELEFFLAQAQTPVDVIGLEVRHGEQSGAVDQMILQDMEAHGAEPLPGDETGVVVTNEAGAPVRVETIRPKKKRADPHGMGSAGCGGCQ